MDGARVIVEEQEDKEDAAQPRQECIRMSFLREVINLNSRQEKVMKSKASNCRSLL